MRVSEHPLTRVLAARGTTKRWLASQLGLHDTQLSHYLAGRRVPPNDFYARAAIVLGVPEEWLHPVAETPVAA